MERPRTPLLPIKLGCPVWNCERWIGEVYPNRTPKSKWLHHYTRMFNTVEGNSTFYGLPSGEVAKRWRDEAADGFRYALKFPREISHELQLVGCERELDRFLEILTILHDGKRLGPTFLQLGPAFGPDRLTALERFLRRLPDEMPWAVEVRHFDWFDRATHESAVNDLLRSCRIDKVLFDSRPLYQSPPDDEIEAASQTRKPKTPVRQTVTAGQPMLRIVGRNRFEKTESFVAQWVPIIAHWINQGLTPYVFTHTPDDRFAPAFARMLWQRLCAHLNAQVPGSADPSGLPKLKRPPEQLSLLD